MKTERRHELKTNDLANWLGQNVDRVRPYSMTILAVVIGVVVLAILWSVWSSRNRQSIEDAWARLDLLSSQAYLQKQLTTAENELKQKYKDDKYSIFAHPEEVEIVELEIAKEVEKLAEEQRSSLVGSVAALSVADDSLRRGVDAIFNGRSEEARTNLDKAARFYQQVADNADDPMLLARAQLGLARTLESRRARDERQADAQDIKVAERNYEQLMGVDYYSNIAKRQLAVLKGESPTGDFYSWIDDQLKRDRDTPSAFGPGFNSTAPGGSDPIFDPSQSGPSLPSGTGPQP